MDNAKVSIIIPAYNAEAYIGDCLDSVLNQTYPHFEVIIVNDGSTDATQDILDAYAKKDERIHVFTQENHGVSYTRNEALSHASGTYITFVDADDTIVSTALEDMVSLMEEDVDFVIASHYEIRLSKKAHIENHCVFEDIKKDFIPYDRLIWWPWAKLYRASIIRKNHLTYDTNITFGEDHVFNLLYSKYIQNKVVVTDKVVYNYHHIRGGLASKYYDNMHEVQKYILLKIADLFGSFETMPPAYRTRYPGAYLKGLVDYYYIWLPFDKAVEKVKESFALYSDVVDDATLHEFFTKKQCALVKDGDFAAFTKDYIRANPKRTVVRKIKRKGKSLLEKLI